MLDIVHSLLNPEEYQKLESKILAQQQNRALKVARNLLNPEEQIQFDLAMSGDGVKKVEDNELETVVVQRRAFYPKKEIPAGTIMDQELWDYLNSDGICLRPCLPDAVAPNKKDAVLGIKFIHDFKPPGYLKWTHFEGALG